MSVLLFNAIHSDQQLRSKRLRTSCSTMAFTALKVDDAKTRHRQWKQNERKKYTLYKRGLFVKQHEITSMYAAGTLTHDYLWYFVHRDPKIERADYIEPKWVVVLCTEEHAFLHPQQPYLTSIYKELNRTHFKSAFTMMPDGTPYWVDIHIARISRDRDAKKRYADKQRDKKKKKQKI